MNKKVEISYKVQKFLENSKVSDKEADVKLAKPKKIKQ